MNTNPLNYERNVVAGFGEVLQKISKINQKDYPMGMPSAITSN